MTGSPATASPLTWPTGWQRTEPGDRLDSRFGRSWNRKPTIAEGVDYVREQLRMMGVHSEDIIISTDLKLRLDGLPYSNQRQPDDPGAAVYWRGPGAEDRVLALDQYNRIGCNLWAIGKTLEALRGVERWGSGEILNRAFTGFTALPSPEVAGGVDPYDLLGITPETPEADRRLAYRKARSRAHPDHEGGSPEAYDLVQRAAQQIGIVG